MQQGVVGDMKALGVREAYKSKLQVRTDRVLVASTYLAMIALFQMWWWWWWWPSGLLKNCSGHLAMYPTHASSIQATR